MSEDMLLETGFGDASAAREKVGRWGEKCVCQCVCVCVREREREREREGEL